MSGIYSKLLRYLSRDGSSTDNKKEQLFGLSFEPEEDGSYLPVIPASTVALEVRELEEKTARLEKHMLKNQMAKLSVMRKAVEDYEISKRSLDDFKTKCENLAVSLLDVNVAQLAECINFFNRSLMGRLLAGKKYDQGVDPFAMAEGRFSLADVLDFQRFLSAALSHLILDRLSQPLETTTLHHFVSSVIKLAQTLLRDHGDLNGFAGVALALLNPSIRRLLSVKMTSAQVKALAEFDWILDPSCDHDNYFTRFHSSKPPSVPWVLPFAKHIDNLLRLYSEPFPLATPQLTSPGRSRLTNLLELLAPTPTQQLKTNPHPLLSHWLLGLPFLSQAQLWKASLLLNPTSIPTLKFMYYPNQSSFPYRPLEAYKAISPSFSSIRSPALRQESLESSVDQGFFAVARPTFPSFPSLEDMCSFDENTDEISSNDTQQCVATSSSWQNIPDSSSDDLIRNLLEANLTEDFPLYDHHSESHSITDLNDWLPSISALEFLEGSFNIDVNKDCQPTFIEVGSATLPGDSEEYPIIRVKGISFTENSPPLSDDSSPEIVASAMPGSFLTAREDDSDDLFANFSYLKGHIKATHVF